MINYGYRQYRTQSVETMTKGEMLVLLYDEINKRLIRAKDSLEKGETQAYESDVQRAVEIINYLSKSLDMKYPISHDLYRLYDFFTFQLTRAKASRKTESIDEILPMIKDLRESFREADKRTKTDPRVSAGIGAMDTASLGVV